MGALYMIFVYIFTFTNKLILNNADSENIYANVHIIKKHTLKSEKHTEILKMQKGMPKSSFEQNITQE